MWFHELRSTLTHASTSTIEPGQAIRPPATGGRASRAIGRLAAILALVLSTGLLSSQEPPKSATGGAAQNHPAGSEPARLLDAKAVLTAAKAVTAEKYPDAKTVLVSKHVRTEYETNGAFTTLTEEYNKVLTEEGRREARTSGFSYNSFYGGFRLVAVQVIKPDGKVIDHDPKQISKEQIDRSQASANIFDPNNKVVEASVPGLEVGDVVRVFSQQWETVPRFAGTFSDFDSLEGTTPIVRATYEFIGPKEKPLRSKVVLAEVPGTVTHEEKEEGGKIRYLWTGRNIPQIFPESGMPSAFFVCQRLLVSTASDWKEVSRWYWNLCEPHLKAATPEMAAKAAELAKQGSTTEEKVRSIFKFVSQEIRYMGITTEKEAPGYEPHDVNITFNNRYGVCRDKAALLVSMLRAAGFEAFPTLVSAGMRLDREAPCCFFNHAITAVRKPDQTYMLMDSTDEHTADLLPKYLANQTMLVACPEGETLITSPIDPAESNMARLKTEVTLAEDGGATGSATFEFDGINDGAYRGSFVSRKPDEIRRAFEGIIKRQLPGGSLLDLQMFPADLQDTSQKLRFTVRFSAPALLVSGGGVAQLDLPYVGRGVAVVGQLLGMGLELEKRRFPLETHFACGVREELTVKLPPSLGEPLLLPAYENNEHSDFSTVMTLSYEPGQNGGTLKGVRDVRLKSPLISPSVYPDLKQAVGHLEINNRQQPVFAKRGSGAEASSTTTADMEVLSRKYSVRVEDPHRWTVREEVKKKVLTYAGKKANAELKLDYNPIWSTVELESATVTLKDATVKKVEPQEMNTLDAGWVASAPRYPAGKTLIVSLPGVEAGSVINYTVKHTYTRQPLFFWETAFASSDRVDDIALAFDFPASFKTKLRADFDGHVSHETKDGRRLITYRWQGLDPVPREISAPPYFIEFPDVILSAGDWTEYARGVAKAIEPCLAGQRNTKAKAKELVAGLTDPVAKITAIRDFVARQIRRAGPGFTQLPLDAAFSPADTVLKDGYGHGGDRAILLDALLKAAGFQPEIVLASRGAKGIPEFDQRDIEFPEASTFETMAVRLPAPTPELKPYVLLDNPSQYAALGATDLDEKAGLQLDGEPVTFRAPESRRDLRDDSVEMKVLDNGTTEITITRRHYGNAHEGFVQQYKEMTAEELRRHHQELVSSISQNAKPIGDLAIDFKYPGTRRFKVSVEHYATRSGDTLYFDLPEMPRSLFYVDSDRRVRPYLQAGRQDFLVNYQIETPAGLKPLIQPQALDWKGPGSLGTFRITASSRSESSATVLNYSLAAHLRPALIPAGSYAQLLDLNRRLTHPSARRILLTKDATKVSGL